MRVIFSGGGTGGHLYPAIAIARALVRMAPRISPFFIGAERGIERHILPTTEFPYRLLPLHPLYRRQPWLITRTIGGLVRSRRILQELARDEMPRMVIGTGGYASFSAVAYARANDVPYLLQEQNGYPGMVTRLFAPRAREICIGYGHAARRLRPGRHTTITETGNPIEAPPEPRPDRTLARRQWGFPEEGGTVLLIFGGSQGSRALNEAVAGWVKVLPPEVYVIWGTGRAMYDDYARLGNPLVRIEPYLSPIADAYAAADLAVSRAGALTLAELCAWGVPSIMVPLPTAAADHQTANSREVAEQGAGVVVPQAELDAERLGREVAAFAQDSTRRDAAAAAALQRARPHAAEDIAGRILTHLDLKQHQT